jgi:hypothetical protein
MTARTKTTLLIGIVAMGTAVALTRGALVGAGNARIIGSYLLVGFPLFTAAWCWWCAADMPSASMRWQWVSFGVAALAFGGGEFLEEFMGQASTSGVSVAKVLYLLAIVTFGAGMWLALHSFKGFLNLRTPMLTSAGIAGIVSVVGVASVWGLFARMQETLADKVLLAVYPVGLLWLMAMPALALALTVSQMGGGALARPWWAVFVGVSLLTVSNMILIVVNAQGTPISNAGPMEIGWWLGLSLISLGAAMQIDVQRPTGSAQ